MPETEYVQTPSQTVGPFYGYALPYEGDAQAAPPWHAEAIRLHGTVTDGAGEPIPDAVLEIWGADASGRPFTVPGSYRRDGRTPTGFGRASTDASGRYAFTTVKPGPGAPGRAPYVLVAVFARGLLHHLFTRAYFGDEPERNAVDPTLAALDPARRSTIVAEADEERSYRFDVRLQGEGETVFFDFGLEGR